LKLNQDRLLAWKKLEARAAVLQQKSTSLSSSSTEETESIDSALILASTEKQMDNKATIEINKDMEKLNTTEDSDNESWHSV
jgi:hypothetical protein